MRWFWWLWLCVGCAASTPRPVETPRTESAEALYLHGVQLAQQGDYLRAEQYLTGALQGGYDPAETTRALVSVCVRGSRLRSALTYAGSYLTAHPSDNELRKLQATLFWSLGDAERAAHELRLVVALDRSDAAAHYLLTLVLAPSAEARPYAERYLELEPDGDHAEEVQNMLDVELAQPGNEPERAT